MLFVCSFVSDLNEKYTASDDKECDNYNSSIHSCYCNLPLDQDTDSSDECIFFIVTSVKHA